MGLLSLANLFIRIKGLPPEVALHIECAKLIAQGQVPYTDFFVLDSPSVLFLTYLPVKLALSLQQETGFALARFTLVFEWLLSMFSLALTAKLFLSRQPLRDSLWCQGLLILLSILNIAWVFQFGQTEHLFVLAITPYIISRWLEYTGRQLRPVESILCGIIGGIAVLFDPLFAILPCTAELFLIWTFMKLPRRLFSPLSVLVVTALAVSGFLELLCPGIMHNYREYILPMIAVDRLSFDLRLYGAGSCSDTEPSIYLLLLATLLYLGMFKRNTLAPLLVVSGWMSFTYFVTESKGYSFQALPMFWFSAMAVTIYGTYLVTDICRWFSQKRITWLHPAPIVLLGLMGAMTGSIYIECRNQWLSDTALERLQPPAYENSQDAADAIKTRTMPLDRVIVMSNNVAPGYPAITLLDRVPGSRLLWSFHLPILARMRETPSVSPAQRKKLTDFYNNILKEDLVKNPSALVMIEDGSGVAELKANGTLALIDEHYVQDIQAIFYSDNRPPREFSNPNYVLRVYYYSF